MMWRRSISILRPSPTTVIPSNVLAGSQLELKPLFQNSAESIREDGTTNVTTTQFQLLGDDPTLASIQVSPSIPLYVRHNSLVSIHDSDRLSNVKLSYKNRFAFWPALSLSRFDKLVGTNTFNCLVSSRRSSDTLSVLQLDGTHDWIVLNPQSIVSFEENSSLSIQWYHKWLNYFKWVSNKVTVFTSYRKLSGRGNVLLNGIGSIYKLELNSEDDQILLQKDRLLAINGLNKLDFQQAVTFEQTSKSLEPEPVHETSDGKAHENFFVETWNGLWGFLETHWNSNSNTDFVRVKGPRTLLVQTDAKSRSPQTWSTSAISLKPAKNYLSVAKIENDGSVNFKNTSSLLEKK
ncbi:unnamed protein product [Kluyveromyces dobzhanskii CBS 2104]|uniref:Altered inheritance of mitochondria protein 24, mitochondrial n=1 Tax=Kluyveromyces dobzhanskii CBS 2104 TaxID=1427455 RepID=A0A0A8L5Q0_9SACH|nr:unnamed protein product [Kluyveromyces dobzhanskii CBS 2104]